MQLVAVAEVEAEAAQLAFDPVSAGRVIAPSAVTSSRRKPRPSATPIREVGAAFHQAQDGREAERRARRAAEAPVPVRATGPEGVAYLKTGAPATRYEARLTAALAAVAPDRVPAVLAVEPEAGWALLADAGPTLRESTGGAFRLDVWRALLTRFAGLQRTAEPLVAELVAAGVPSEQPADFPRLVSELVLTSPRLADLSADERDRLKEMAERWPALAERLDGFGVPSSVQHGDLHDGNVAVGADGHARFFDFGDASVSHPFTTMLIPLRVAGSMGASPADQLRLKEAYLDGYDDLAARSDLREALDLALEVAAVVRVTSWDRALCGPPVPGDDPQASTDAWDDAVSGWLRELLSGSMGV